MKIEVMAIKDQQTNAFGQPIFVPTIGAAIRMFGDEINRNADNNQLYKHPEDFSLYHLGSYDDNAGKFQNLDAPTCITTGKQVKIGE